MKASKTLQYVIIGLTILGVCVLFAMLVPVSAGAMFSLMCLVVVVAFSMHYLFKYVNSPDIPAKVNDKKIVFIHEFRSQAYYLASREIGCDNKYDLVTHTHFDTATDSIMLWVTHKRSGVDSNIYYYNKKDKSM